MQDEANRECQNLVNLRDSPGIAELLISFLTEDDHFQYKHLVFDYYECTLEGALKIQSVAALPGPLKPNWFPVPPEYSITRSMLWQAAIGLVEAVAELHESSDGTLQGAHFDIKPANVVVDSHCKLLLIDLEHARLRTPEQSTKFHAVPGGETYGAPEGHLHDEGTAREGLGQSYDVWSLGCILLEFLICLSDLAVRGRNPVSVENFRDARRDENSAYVSRDFWRELDGRPCLKPAVVTQIRRFQNAAEHGQEIARAADQICQMLTIKESARPTARDCAQRFREQNQLDVSVFIASGLGEVASSRLPKMYGLSLASNTQVDSLDADARQDRSVRNRENARTV